MIFDSDLADIAIFLNFRFKSTINQVKHSYIQRTALKIAVLLNIHWWSKNWNFIYRNILCCKKIKQCNYAQFNKISKPHFSFLIISINFILFEKRLKSFLKPKKYKLFIYFIQ